MKSKKVSKQDSAYPSGLLSLAQIPEQLYVRGAPLEHLQGKTTVAVVGSRKVSNYGRQVTEKLVSELAKAGVVIVSGLALGVDSIAHKAALDAGGTTVAVLPCGIDTIYPASHYGLAKRILQSGGTLLSEYPGNDTPQKHHFIARNRIIAALSDGVLITEAAAKSGSLHTADFALELGIDVLAVPGNITSPTSEGANALIKNGAAAITNSNDIFELMNIRPTTKEHRLPAHDAKTFAVLDSGPATLDEIATQTKLDFSDLQQSLTSLELKGLITLSASGEWQKV